MTDRPNRVRQRLGNYHLIRVGQQLGNYHPSRIGQQLGNYRLIRLLGAGGFAEVYLGEHIHLGTKAAVKVFHAQLTHEHVEAFRTEARTIAHLVHLHIVRVIDFGIEGRTPFLVMDYAPNGTLRNLHPKGSSLALATIIPYIKQVADALQYAHDEKLIHRDIKPENMLVSQRNEVLLSDFGITLVAQSSRYQSIQQVIRTVVYMSPEHIQGKPGPTSDQYSLGIVVYEWLTGDRPFHGSFTEVCTQHMFAPPPPLREKRPSLSRDIEQVVMIALAKDPKQRFASVQAFATALEQASQPLPPTVLATRAHRSYEPIMLPPNHSSALEQANQPKQSPPSLSLLVATPPSQPLPPTVLATPPYLPELTTQAAPPSYSSHVSEVLGTQQPMPQPTSHVSRRTLIAGLVGLTLVDSEVTYFTVLHSSISKPAPGTTPTPLPLGTTLYVYRGYADQAWSVAWSPDGKRITSSSRDGTVQVWDATYGGHVYTYTGHANVVLSVAWSPDGKRIASSSWDKTVQVWNAADGSHVYTYRGHSNTVWSVAWSPDGKHITSGSDDKTVQVWDATDGSHVYTYTGHSDLIYSVAWSPDGKRIASGSQDTTVKVWDANNGCNPYTYTGHAKTVWSVAWSPDGKRIASGSWDKTVQVWDAIDGKNVYTKGHSNTVWSVAWSPDGKRIASGSFAKTVHVWNAADGSHVYIYRGHSDTIYSVAWSPDSKCIASASFDKTVQIWVASGTNKSKGENKSKSDKERLKDFRFFTRFFDLK